MRVSIILTVIVLVVLLLAFAGIFGRFPDKWEWIGIILAGVGIAMATPSIFQMLWGRPSMKVEFERGVEGNNRCLIVNLKNLPVRNRILRMLGVRRDSVQSLTISFRISEFGSGKILDPIRQAIIYSDEYVKGEGRYRIVLPPTFSVGANFMVIVSDIETNKAFVPPDRLRPLLEIPPGYYQIVIAFMIDGEPMQVVRQFRIGEKADELMWTKL